MADACDARVRALRLGNVRVHRARGEALPVPDACADSVLLLQSLQYMDEPAQAVAEALRVLAPGGRLLALTLARHQHVEAERYGHRHHGFTDKELRQWCRGLRDVHLDPLPPEARQPRFQTIVVTGVK
jgi:ArsR family transcriptional regulator